MFSVIIIPVDILAITDIIQQVSYLLLMNSVQLFIMFSVFVQITTASSRNDEATNVSDAFVISSVSSELITVDTKITPLTLSLVVSPCTSFA